MDLRGVRPSFVDNVIRLYKGSQIESFRIHVHLGDDNDDDDGCSGGNDDDGDDDYDDDDERP